jgi:hypothetical protein
VTAAAAPGAALAALVTPALAWLGAGLAAVPIVIHLLSRRRVRRVRWAAMQWLLAAMKRHQRRLRLENWLILALRVAAVALLGLALARPILSDSPIAGLGGTKRSVYLVLDNSASAEAKVDARSVLDRVKHEADRALAALGSEDSVAVVVTNDPREDASSGLDAGLLAPRQVGSEATLRAREAIALLRARHAPASWPAALARVREQVRPEDVNRTVLVVTDLQAGDWAGPQEAGSTEPAADRLREELIALLRLPARVRIVDVGGPDRRNLSVDAITVRGEHEPFAARPVELAVRVANHGTSPIEGVLLEIEVEGRPGRISRQVPPVPAADAALRVPRPGTADVQVTLPRDTFPDAGSYAVRASVRPSREDPGADALGLDSVRALALRVRSRVRVVGWAETSRTEVETGERDAAHLYLRALYGGEALPGELDTSAALAPPYAYRGARSESELRSLLLSRDRFPVDLVVLANVEPRDDRLLQALRDFVREGGGLLVFAGDRISHPDAWNSAFHTADPATRLMPYPAGPVELRARGQGDEGDPFLFDLGQRDGAHPLVSPFTNDEAANWIQRSPPQIWGRVAFVEPEGPEADPASGAPEAVVLRFAAEPGRATGPPAVLASSYGDGRTVWVATSIDNGWLARAGWLFLPVFLEEAARWLTSSPEPGLNTTVGATIEAQLPAAWTDVRFAVPGGRHVVPTRLDEETPGGRATWRLRDAGVAGVWSLSGRLPEAEADARDAALHFAVNLDPRESTLLPARAQHVLDGLPEGLDVAFVTSLSDLEEEIEEAREGDISRELLYAAVLLLLLESLLALRFGRLSVQHTEAAPEGA